MCANVFMLITHIHVTVILCHYFWKLILLTSVTLDNECKIEATSMLSEFNLSIQI